MGVMAGYEQTDIGVLPRDWAVSTISAHATASSGTTPPRALAERYYRDGSHAWVKTLDLNNSVIRSTEEKVTETALRETALRLYPAGTVVVAMYGGYKQIGRTGLLAMPACVNQALTAIRTDSRTLDSKYLLFTLNSRVDHWKTIASSSRKDPNITGKDVAAFPIAVPPIFEQKAIAEALSDAESLIESLEQLVAKKRQIKEGALQDLLTGKKRLQGFSGDWPVKMIGDLFCVSGGYSASREQLSNDGYCYLHYGDIHRSDKTFIDIRADFQDIPKLDVPLKRVPPGAILEDGDVVFVDASEDDEGTSRHFVVVNPDGKPFISGLHTIVAKERKKAELDHLYRRYCFQTLAVKSQFRFFAVGTKVSGISKTNVRRISLLVPGLEEQKAIASILSDIDIELAALETKLSKARQLKKGMMQELLTGRIRLV